MKDNLKDLLGTWQPTVPEPSDFRHNVWRKVETSSQTAEWGWLVGLFVLISRPRVAFAVVACAILIGGLAGSGISSANEASNYLRSVNPYAQLK